MNDYNSYSEYKASKTRTGKTTRSGKKTSQTKSSRPQNAKNTKKTKNNQKTKKSSKSSKLTREQKRILKQEKKAEKKQRRQEYIESVGKIKMQIFIACLVIFYTAMAITILSNNSTISELQLSINKVNADIIKEKNIVKELEAERESTYKSETIENFAKYKLNMVYPSKEQIVYINID